MFHISMWGMFILGFFLGFVLASFLVGWTAEQHEKELEELRVRAKELQLRAYELKKALNAIQGLQKSVKDDFGV